MCYFRVLSWENSVRVRRLSAPIKLIRSCWEQMLRWFSAPGASQSPFFEMQSSVWTVGPLGPVGWGGLSADGGCFVRREGVLGWYPNTVLRTVPCTHTTPVGHYTHIHQHYYFPTSFINYSFWIFFLSLIPCLRAFFPLQSSGLQSFHPTSTTYGRNRLFLQRTSTTLSTSYPTIVPAPANEPELLHTTTPSLRPHPEPERRF